MNDPTLAQLPGLEPKTRELAVQLINEARAVGVPLVIVELGGRRTYEQQVELVRKRLSKTFDSLHLYGEAFDVDVLGVNRDAVPRWWWQDLGQAGKQLGLAWGGDWGWDFAHFERIF